MFKKLRKRYCICNMKKGLFAREGKCIFCELFIETDKILAEKVEEVKNNIIKLKKLNCGICGNQLNHRSDKVLNFAVPRNDVEKEIDKIFKSEARIELAKVEFLELGRKEKILLLKALDIDTKNLRCKYCEKKVKGNKFGIVPTNKKGRIIICDSPVCMSNYLRQIESEAKQ